jgi:hypothetical protein
MMLKVERVEINSVNIRKTQRKKRVLFFIVLTFKEKNVHIPRSRLLNWLRSVFPSNIVGSGHRNFRTIPTEVTKYLHWWQLFLLQYNGVSMISYNFYRRFIITKI